MIKSPKQKGMTLEYAFRDLLITSGLDVNARRSIMSGAAFEPADIATVLPFNFECKFNKKMALYKFWDQVTKANNGKKPALVLKANNRPILVAILAEDFIKLLQNIDPLTNN